MIPMTQLCLLITLSATIGILKIDWTMAKHKTTTHTNKQLELLSNALIVFVGTVIAENSGKLTLWGNIVMIAAVAVALVNVGLVLVALFAARRK